MRKLLFITALTVLATSCSPTLPGTWNVDRYEVDSQDGPKFSTRNAGELILHKNGTGEKNVEYNMFQNEFTDFESFRWNMQGKDLITITSDSGKESDFDKTWIMTTNTKKKQVWKSTDGQNTVQVLELTKK